MSVVLETTIGDLTIDLFTEARPHSCKNFLKLCKIKYYNFCLFHHIQANFVAQTGDPSGTGSGGESVYGIISGKDARYYQGEKKPKIKHDRPGLVSMVHCGDNLVGSQFFITLGEDTTCSLDEHIVFGSISEGHDILLKLNETICDNSHRPYQDIRITHTVILDDPYNDPNGLIIPDSSPKPPLEVLQSDRIGADEDITEDVDIAELEERREEKEALARATILEIVGDLPSAEIAPPENVLFVCKLNPVTSDDDLQIIFSRFGKIISCEVIRDKKSGNSLQYAFVEFDNQKSCEDAYLKMDNVLIDDRRIHVDFSQSVSKIKYLGKGRIKYMDKEDEGKNISDKYSKNRNKNINNDRANHNVDRDKKSDYQSERYRKDEQKYKHRDNDREDKNKKFEKSNSHQRVDRNTDDRRHSKEEIIKKKDRNDRERKNERDDREKKNERDNREKKNERDDREKKNERDDREKKIERGDRDKKSERHSREEREKKRDRDEKDKSYEKYDNGRRNDKDERNRKIGKHDRNNKKDDKNIKRYLSPSSEKYSRSNDSSKRRSFDNENELSKQKLNKEVTPLSNRKSTKTPEKKRSIENKSSNKELLTQSDEKKASKNGIRKKRRSRSSSTISTSSSSSSDSSSSSSSSSSTSTSSSSSSCDTKVIKYYDKKGKLVKVVKNRDSSSNSDRNQKRRHKKKIVKVYKSIKKRKKSLSITSNSSSSDSEDNKKRRRKKQGTKKSNKKIKA